VRYPDYVQEKNIDTRVFVFGNKAKVGKGKAGDALLHPS
jgi:hypothetical protein